MHSKAGMSTKTRESLGTLSKASNETTQYLTTIECESCHYVSFSHVDYLEADALLCNGSISRSCPRCGDTTKWSQVDIHPMARKPAGKSAKFEGGSRSAPKHPVH